MPATHQTPRRTALPPPPSRPRRRNPWRRRPRPAAAAGGGGGMAAVATGLPQRTTGSYTRELAGPRQCEWIWGDGELPHPSQILLDESDPSHRLGELYRVMRRDDTALCGMIEKRINAVLGLPRSIQATEASDRGKQTALFCREALRRIPKLHVNLGNQLLATWDGVAFEEILWDPAMPTVAGVKAAWVPRDLRDRPMWRFAWRAPKDQDVDYQLHIRTRNGGTVPAPPGSFLINVCGSKDGPWGVPRMDSLYWMYFLKLRAWKNWGIAGESWARPAPIGTYPNAASGTPDVREKANQERQDDVLQAAEALAEGRAIAIPDDVKFDIIEAKNNAGLTYEAFVGACDRAMALRIIGEVDTSGLSKGPGSYAKSRVSNEVRWETLVADAHELETHLTDNLLALLVALNFGPGWPVPRFSIDVLDATDRDQRQRGVERFAKFRLPMLEDELYRIHQVTKPGEGDVTVLPVAGAPASSGSADDQGDQEDEAA